MVMEGFVSFRFDVARQEGGCSLLETHKQSIANQEAFPLALFIEPHFAIAIKHHLRLGDSVVPYDVRAHPFVLHARRDWILQPRLPSSTIDAVKLDQMWCYKGSCFLFVDSRHGQHPEVAWTKHSTNYKNDVKIFRNYSDVAIVSHHGFPDGVALPRMLYEYTV
ncbi:protein of unknown function [Cupriavidus taiwanensis]|nr:protein of unknown function [Cupriavidus taiwanensis]